MTGTLPGRDFERPAFTGHRRCRDAELSCEIDVGHRTQLGHHSFIPTRCLRLVGAGTCGVSQPIGGDGADATTEFFGDLGVRYFAQFRFQTRRPSSLVGCDGRIFNSQRPAFQHHIAAVNSQSACHFRIRKLSQKGEFRLFPVPLLTLVSERFDSQTATFIRNGRGVGPELFGDDRIGNGAQFFQEALVPRNR